MNAPVFERTGQDPYPQSQAAVVRPFTGAPAAVDVPARAVTVPPAPTFTPRASQSPRVTVARTDRAAMARALDGLQGLDYAAVDAAKAVPGLTYAGVLAETAGLPAPDTRLPIHDAVATGHGTAPQPVTAAMPGSTATGWPEGMIRGMLVSQLWEAACWYDALDASCRDCERAGERCGFHAPRHVKAIAYEDLHDLAAEAPADAAALAAVVAACRAGTADPGDFTSPGSALSLILTAALATETAHAERSSR